MNINTSNKPYWSFLALTILLFLLYSVLSPVVKSASMDKEMDAGGLSVATFAGGCFWCMEHPFEKLKGVDRVISGYTGGHVKNPAYKQVSAGTTGHLEAVQIHFDPQKISYEELLQVYWQQIDPTDNGGSFVDRGEQYSSAIFFHNEKQKEQAMNSLKILDRSRIYPKPIVVKIRKAEVFYAAEAFHQNYAEENPIRYKFYRFKSGRDQYLDTIWSKHSMNEIWNVEKTTVGFVKPSDSDLRKRLTKLQYKVTQEDGTERSFNNEYWDNKKAGIYVDIVSGEPLFSSTDKYDSKTGWPSFTKPIDGINLVEVVDRKLFYSRTELRSPLADSHLGHVFDDGPAPTGKRYCINSASLKFVPKENLKKEGYENWLSLFDK